MNASPYAMPAPTWLGLFGHSSPRSAKAIHYLHTLDGGVQAAFPERVHSEHAANVVDIAHARWAAGSAVTALDLCAAALALGWCGWTRPNAVSFRDFTPGARNRATQVAELRASVPVVFLSWIDQVLADAHYTRVSRIRHALTHARLPRGFHIPAKRTDIHFEEPPGTRVTMNAPQVVEMARDLATRHCVSFVREVMNLA